MEEYLSAQAGMALDRSRNTAPPPRPSRPLEGIGTAADRIAKVNERLMEIHERFHGPAPKSDMAGEPISVSYISQVSRLHSNIQQLENLVAALDDAA